MKRRRHWVRHVKKRFPHQFVPASSRGPVCRKTDDHSTPSIRVLFRGALRSKVAASTVLGFPMTQQYLVGELSSLLAGLQPTPSESLGNAVDKLRHEVESSPPRMLPSLAQQALDLTDIVCRVALEQGDADGFCRSVGTAIALRDFTVGAGLLP